MDLARELVGLLEGEGLTVTLGWAWSGFPTVTATCKPMVSPVASLLIGPTSTTDVLPVSPEGKAATKSVLFKLMQGEGWETDNALLPDGKLWSSELHPKQTTCAQNWAVGFYNGPGGYAIGNMWKDPLNPKLEASIFPANTVVGKLLFTSAPPDEVPFLKDALVWQGNIYEMRPTATDPCASTNRKSVTDLRLLQIDLAVREPRADGTTGWIFATYVYRSDGPGSDPWTRLVPVGLMWGNDPNLLKAQYDTGARPQETWLNKVEAKLPHYGWLDRLNGPVDNPRASCLGCNAIAQWPEVRPMAPPANASEAQIRFYFRNVKAGERYDSGNPSQISLDYSLQQMIAYNNFLGGKGAMEKAIENHLSPQAIEPFGAVISPAMRLEPLR